MPIENTWSVEIRHQSHHLWTATAWDRKYVTKLCLFVTRVVYFVAISALPDQSNRYSHSPWMPIKNTWSIEIRHQSHHLWLLHGTENMLQNIFPMWDRNRNSNDFIWISMASHFEWQILHVKSYQNLCIPPSLKQPSYVASKIGS